MNIVMIGGVWALGIVAFVVYWARLHRVK